MLDEIILVFERETREVMYFSGLRAAESYMEAPDADVYEAYSKNGEIIQVSVDPVQPKFWQSQIIRLIPTSQNGQERIGEQLRQYLRTRGEIVAEGASLGGMVAALQRIRRPT
jgi:hypothetical protein